MKSVALFLSGVLATYAFSVERHTRQNSALCAIPPSNAGGWGYSRGVPSKTARESACNVEWEPMSELERRIEDGVNYEHIPLPLHKRKKERSKNSGTAPHDGIPTTQGVFCGYRYTSDEYDRLKSADPSR
eukprot:scaffold8798_cov117-Cylindrotheca_fusiformis.AAC.3